MKILYLHRTKGRSVEGVHIWSIVEAFRDMGHEVDVVSPDGSQNEYTALAANTSSTSSERSLFSYMSSRVPEFVFELIEMAYNIVAFPKALLKAHRNGVQLIYERYAIFAFAGALLASSKKIPLILEVNYTSCSPLVRQRSKILAPFARWVDSWVFSHATSLAVVSSYLREHLIDDYGVDHKRIVVVPNAADPGKFAVDTSSADVENGASGNYVIGFVGGFYPWHGVELLVDAFQSIAEELPRARLLLVGDGPERAAIEKRVADYSLQSRVEFAGVVGHAALPSYISRFTVGVMPDSNVYGSPMKIFEYMAMAKPVVVPDYEPLLDVVEDGVQGVIFRRGEVRSLAQNMLRILRKRELITVMSANARAHIENERNWLRNAEINLDFIGLSKSG